MEKIHLPARAGAVAHKAHGFVQRCEVLSHVAYLGLVSVGSHSYHLAAAAMLTTVVVSGILHAVIHLAGEA